MTTLSILDLVRVTEETDARGALYNARDVAVHAEDNIATKDQPVPLGAAKRRRNMPPQEPSWRAELDEVRHQKTG